MSLRSNVLLIMALTMPLQVPAAVVINELVYDVAGADVGEFIELHNTAPEPADISGWTVVLVDGATGASYLKIPIPAGSTIAGGGYYTIGEKETFARCKLGVPDLDFPLDNKIEDGSKAGEGGPEAVILRDNLGVRRDSLAYEADNRFFAGPDTAEALAEGGTGRVVSGHPETALYSIGRLPDGVDSDFNLLDFANVRATPGAANKASIELPFRDSFEKVDGSPWANVFVDTLQLVDPTAKGKPGKPSPDGGKCLEVLDPSGGGNGLYIPGAWDKLNYEGYIWIPAAAANGWSVGVGIGTRSEGGWFPSNTGEPLENGFYLEYENGPLGGTVTGLRRSSPVATTPAMRLLAVDSSRAINSGNVRDIHVSPVAVITDTFLPGDWNRFRLIFDRPANRLAAFINGKAIFDGPFPKGRYNPTGGVSVGWREYHKGTPDRGEGTWIDGVVVDTNVEPEPTIKGGG